MFWKEPYIEGFKNRIFKHSLTPGFNKKSWWIQKIYITYIFEFFFIKNLIQTQWLTCFYAMLGIVLNSFCRWVIGDLFSKECSTEPIPLRICAILFVRSLPFSWAEFFWPLGIRVGISYPRSQRSTRISNSLLFHIVLYLCNHTFYILIW